MLTQQRQALPVHLFRRRVTREDDFAILEEHQPVARATKSKISGEIGAASGSTGGCSEREAVVIGELTEEQTKPREAVTAIASAKTAPVPKRRRKPKPKPKLLAGQRFLADFCLQTADAQND